MNEAIHRIEHFRPDFEYDEAREYVRLVKKFFAGMQKHLTESGLPLETPFVDSVSDGSVLLPVAISERLESVMSEYDEYGTTIRNVCLWHLSETLAVERGTIERNESLYEPLMEVLEKGGYFYEHHGALAVSDAAMIPFIGR